MAVASLVVPAGFAILTYGLAGSLLGQTPELGGVPIREFLGAGAAGVVGMVVYFYIRHVDQVHQRYNEQHKDSLATSRAVAESHAKAFETMASEHSETIKAIGDQFSTTATNLSTKFSETTASLLRDARSESLQREQNLRALFESFTKDKP